MFLGGWRSWGGIMVALFVFWATRRAGRRGRCVYDVVLDVTVAAGTGRAVRGLMLGLWVGFVEASLVAGWPYWIPPSLRVYALVRPFFIRWPQGCVGVCGSSFLSGGRLPRWRAAGDLGLSTRACSVAFLCLPVDRSLSALRSQENECTFGSYHILGCPPRVRLRPCFPTRARLQSTNN